MRRHGSTSNSIIINVHTAGFTGVGCDRWTKMRPRRAQRNYYPVPPSLEANYPYPQTLGGKSPSPPNLGGKSPSPPNLGGKSPSPPSLGGKSPSPPNLQSKSPLPPNLAGKSPLPPNLEGKFRGRIGDGPVPSGIELDPSCEEPHGRRGLPGEMQRPRVHHPGKKRLG